MGSSGTNRFSDYSGGPSGSSHKMKPKGGGAGGGEGVNECARAIGNVPLEDVERSEYINHNGALPKPKRLIRIRKNLLGGRLAVETVDTKEAIGLLPTRYSYLRGCMEQGYAYEGAVVSTTKDPMPGVRVDLGSQK